MLAPPEARKKSVKSSNGHDRELPDSRGNDGGKKPAVKKQPTKLDPPDDPGDPSDSSEGGDGHHKVGPVLSSRSTAHDLQYRTREAAKIEVPGFPSIARLAAYKLTMLENIVCASGREDHQNVAKWVLQVEKKGKQH